MQDLKVRAVPHSSGCHGDEDSLENAVWELISGLDPVRDGDGMKRLLPFLTSGEMGLEHFLVEIKEQGLPGEVSRRAGLLWRVVNEIFALRSDKSPASLNTPAKIWEAFPQLRKAQQEILKAVYLDVKNRMLGHVDVAVGSYNTVAASPADIFSPALEFRSRRFVLIHNHPSGDTAPSEDDLRFTRKLRKASEILGIDFMDHLIFGRDCYYSFREAGLI